MLRLLTRYFVDEFRYNYQAKKDPQSAAGIGASCCGILHNASSESKQFIT